MQNTNTPSKDCQSDEVSSNLVTLPPSLSFYLPVYLDSLTINPFSTGVPSPVTMAKPLLCYIGKKTLPTKSSPNLSALLDIVSVKLALDLAHTGVVSRLHNVKTVDIVVYT